MNQVQPNNLIDNIEEIILWEDPYQQIYQNKQFSTLNDLSNINDPLNKQTHLKEQNIKQINFKVSQQISQSDDETDSKQAVKTKNQTTLKSSFLKQDDKNQQQNVTGGVQNSTSKSVYEQKKIVGNYMFVQREPFHISPISRLYISVSLSAQQMVMMKIIDKKYLDEEFLKKFIKEYQQLRKKSLKLKNLVTLSDFFQTEGNVYLVYEFIQYKSLHDLSYSYSKEINLKDLFVLIKKTMDACDDIKKSLKLLHIRNIKMQNIFYNFDKLEIKIMDFNTNYINLKNIINQKKEEEKEGIIQQSKRIQGVYMTHTKLIQEESHHELYYIAKSFLILYYGNNFRKHLASKETLNDYFTTVNTGIKDKTLFDRADLPVDVQNWCTDCMYNQEQKWEKGKEFCKKFINAWLLADKINPLKKKEVHVGNAVLRNFEKEYGQQFLFQILSLSEAASKIHQYDKGNIIDKCVYIGYEFKFSTNFLRLKIDYDNSRKLFKENNEFIRVRDINSYYYDIRIFSKLQENTKYKFEIISEVDDVPYFDIAENRSLQDEDNLQLYNFDIYEQLLKKKKVSIKVLDKVSNQFYLIKQITSVNDTTFHSILKEISICIFLRYSENIRLKFKFQDELIDVNQSENTIERTNHYLSSLYSTAVDAINLNDCQIHKIQDAFFIKKGDNLFSVYLIFQDYDYSLKDFLIRNRNNSSYEHSQIEVLLLCQQLAKRLHSLKKHGIAHNNIAPENILITRRGDNVLQFFISNFEHCIVKKDKFVNVQQSLLLQDVENLKYKSPEIYDKLCNSNKVETFHGSPITSDIYSLGILLLEIKIKQIIHLRTLKLIVDQLDMTAKVNLKYINKQIFNQDVELILLMLNDNEEGRIKLNLIMQQSNVELRNMQIQTNIIFVYSEYSLLEMGTQEADISFLALAKVYRRLQQYEQSYDIMVILHDKYLQKSQNFEESWKIKILLMLELGNFYRDKQENDKALEFYDKCIHERIQYKYGNILDDIEILTNISIIKHGQIQLLNQNLKLMEVAYDQKSPHLIGILFYQAGQYESNNMILEALQIYQRLSILIKEKIGFEGPIGIQVIDKLACLFYMLSDFNNSLIFYQISLTLRDHHAIADCLNNCGETYRQLGSYFEAEEYYEKALKVIWDQKRDQQEFISQIYNNLAIIYKQRGKKKQAFKLYQECHKIRSEILGKEHQETLSLLLNIGILHNDLGFHTKAIKYFQDIIDYFETKKITKDNLFAQAQLCTGVAYYNLARYNKALSYFNVSLNLKKQIFGISHITVANALQNIGIVFHRLGQYKKSMAMYDDALKIYYAKLGSQNFFVKTIQQNLMHTKKFVQF